MIVVAYGLLLPADILRIPVFGCWNIHASLLPRWRGAAPIQRAIEAGDHETGVSIMQMDAGLDTGPVIHRQRITLDGERNGRQPARPIGGAGRRGAARLPATAGSRRAAGGDRPARKRGQLCPKLLKERSRN